MAASYSIKVDQPGQFQHVGVDDPFFHIFLSCQIVSSKIILSSATGEPAITSMEDREDTRTLENKVLYLYVHCPSMASVNTWPNGVSKYSITYNGMETTTFQW